MRKKQFKAESKKLLDMMINSIYTNREIFLRELISNASDAIDKLYFKSLTDTSITLKKEDYKIKIDADTSNNTITITDNGIGMSQEDLESNLGTIAKSGSQNFKKENSDSENIDDVEVIGQFGVGFYSSFMVAKKVVVESKAYGSDVAYRWESEGVDGYSIEECEKDETGTIITLYLKDDTDDDKYSDFASEYKIRELIKKYSDYIRYPIITQVSKSIPDPDNEGEYITEVSDETINSMVPMWRKAKSELKDEDYNSFYKQTFFDYEDPQFTIHFKTEGTATFTSLVYLPKNPPMDFYSKDFKKGLQLYSNGVLIMDKCSDLLPDYFNFAKGLVDSSDLSLNISRETLQQDHQVKIIAKAIEKKIKAELQKALKNDREKYEEFFKAFGTQIKWGIYADYGLHKDDLKDLIMFESSNGEGYTTLKEYCDRMADSQDKIYYACGDSAQKISLLPQCEAVKAKGYEVLYFTDEVDEFAIQVLMNFDDKAFANVANADTDLSTDAEKEALKKENEEGKDLLDKIKEFLGGEVENVKYVNSIGSHAVTLTAEGYMSLDMVKTLSNMPNAGPALNAQLVLQLNPEHPVVNKLKDADDEKLKKYSNILYQQARLIAGLPIENPTQFADDICEMMA